MFEAWHGNRTDACVQHRTKRLAWYLFMKAIFHSSGLLFSVERKSETKTGPRDREIFSLYHRPSLIEQLWRSTTQPALLSVSPTPSLLPLDGHPLKHKRRRELEPRYVPQLFLGLLLWTHRSAIGRFLFPVTVPEVFAKVNSARGNRLLTPPISFLFLKRQFRRMHLLALDRT